MIRRRSLSLEIGSLNGLIQANGKLPRGFLTILIQKLKNHELKPVYKPAGDTKIHHLDCSDDDWMWLGIQANKHGLKISRGGRNGLIRALINGLNGLEEVKE